MITFVGIIGGGIMGGGLARHFLSRGLRVGLVEADRGLAEKSRVRLEKTFESESRKGKLTGEELGRVLANLETGADLALLGRADFVIEAVSEDLELKRRLLAHLERHLSPGTLIGSNTSALPISAIAAALSSPGRFVGTHFFNPAHLMPLVEVVPGLDTAPGVVGQVMAFLASTGKRPVRVKECPGFLVNRILGAFINEAMWLLQETAGILELDACAKEMGLPMGPAVLGDMVGWDVIHASNRTLGTYYGSRFEVPPLFNAIKAAGRYGLKTGLGLYDHTKTPPEPTGDLVPARRGLGGEGAAAAILRMRSAILAEGLRCLDECVATAGDIDLAMTLGAGFPKGPVAWADEIGLETLVDQLLQLSDTHGPRFWPAPIVRVYLLAGYEGRSAGRGLAGRYVQP